MHRSYGVCTLVLTLLILGGCTTQHKTKEQLVSEGIKLVQQKDPRGAIILFRNALEKDQNYFEARFQLAKAYNATGNFTAAGKELEKVKRQNPSSREVQIEIARVMAYTNRPDDALRELSAYLGEDSADCDALEIAGWAHSMKEEHPVAVSLLKKAIAKCGAHNVSPMLSLATVYVSAGDMTEAETQIQQVLSREPEDRRALYLLVEVQTRRKDMAAAVKTLDRIIAANPRDIDARYRKGLWHVESGDQDKALALAQEIMKKFPERPEGHRLQGFALFFKKQYDDAIAPLQKSLIRQPNAGTYYMLGLVHYFRNEAEQAANQFQKALDLQPTLAPARAHLALILLNRKRPDDAIREAKTALAQDNDNALAHNVLGSAYLTKGDHEEGLAELNKALSLEPSMADVHIKKGLLALKRGKGQEAESELAAAVRLKPESQDSRRILSLHYLNRNEPAKAIDVLRNGIQHTTSDAVSYYLMGEAYLRLQNVNEAKIYFLKAKEADPKYDLAYLKLASIHFMQEKQEEGIRELRSLVEHSPNNTQALLLLASFAEINGDETEARTMFLRAAETNKAEGIIAAARYFQRTNDAGRALKLLNEGISQAPADIRLHETKGNLLLANKNFKEALTAFEAIERHNAQAGFLLIVNTYLAMGEYAKAFERVQAEIRNKPTDLSLQAELSRVYYRAGNSTKAVENARALIRKHPESSVGWLALALVYQSGKETDKAIETLRSSGKGKDVAVALMLGNLYSLKKNYPLALEQYRKAESAKPGSDQILFQKGSTLHAMGRKKEADAEYQKVLRLAPNHAMTLNNLAYLFAEENRDLPQALNYATRAFMVSSQNDFIRDTLGYVLLKNGRTEQAMRMLKKASETSPKSATIQYHLALAYKENGDRSRARETLEKALSLGDFPEAREAQALLEKLRKNGKS